MLNRVGLHDKFWQGLMDFVDEEMVPKYKELLNGKFLQNEAGVTASEDADDAFFGILETLLQSAVTDPKKVGKRPKYYYIYFDHSQTESSSVRIHFILYLHEYSFGSAS